MFASKINRFNKIEMVGLSSFSAIPGVSITPGTSSANGSWTSWATPADDVYGIWVNISGGATSGVAKNQTIDIGVDASGGTSYTVVLQDFLCGYVQSSATTSVQYGRQYYFPLRVNAGARIGIRARGSHTTAGTIAVWGRLMCQPSNPELVHSYARAETLGYTSNTLGTAFTTSSGSASPDSWTQLGTTGFNWKQCVLTIQTNSAAYNGANVFFPEVAYGDGTNFTQVLYDVFGGPIFNTEAASQPLWPTPLCVCNIPAGQDIYIRSKCAVVNTLNTGYSAVVAGFGD